MALQSEILAGSSRLDQAAAGGPSIKKAPPADDVDAVQRIQRALVELGFPMPNSFPAGPHGEPDGIFGNETFNKLQAFQRREFPDDFKQWDGRAGKNTLGRMDELLGGAAPTGDDDFSGFNGEQIGLIKADLQRSRRMLDRVVQRLRVVAAMGPGGALLVTPRTVDYYNTKLAIRDVFEVNTFVADDLPIPAEILPQLRRLRPNLTISQPSSSPVDALNFATILTRFSQLRRALDARFPKVFYTDPTFKGSPIGFFAAFVDATNPADATVRFTRRYFEPAEVDDDGRSVTIAHERAHTIFRAPGHPGTGDSPFCVAPHEGDPRVTTFEQANSNPYCYEWLIYALQPNYNPRKHRGIECGT